MCIVQCTFDHESKANLSLPSETLCFQTVLIGGDLTCRSLET